MTVMTGATAAAMRSECVSARRFGTAPVGLPAGAGYAVGNGLADAYLTATGRTAAQALRDDHAEVVRIALDRLGR